MVRTFSDGKTNIVKLRSLSLGAWTDEHLRKWDDLAEASMETMTCAVCAKGIDTTVCTDDLGRDYIMER